MKILVTGAAGFIGSHLCRTLLSQNHTVWGIDNFDEFYAKTIKERNIEDLLIHPNFIFSEVDICQNYSLPFNQLLLQRFDMVIHLAAKAGVLSSIENIDGYLKTNVLGTKNVLELMRKINCSKIVFASSSSIYGVNNAPPFSETGNTDFPITPYAASKKSCELLMYNYHTIFNFDVINLRFFTVYGPAQRPDLVIHKFTKLIYNNQPITLYGSGNSQRDYTYIDDIIEGVIKAVDLIKQTNNIYECINLGNNNPIQLLEVVEMLYTLLEKPKNIIFEKEKKGDMPITCADISKAQKLLGYNPQTHFYEGLGKFIAWFNNSVNSIFIILAISYSIAHP